jgi:hypothetical protein
MNISEYIGDIILLLVLAFSTLLLAANQNFDPVNTLAILAILLSLGGLIVLVHYSVMKIEREMINRERMIRVNLEEISLKMAQKYDNTIAHVDGVVEEFSKRVYR